jgi:glycosyltransferase involved in cell wall biosynthesis
LTSPVLLDISRLVWGARRVGPTGIDRIELAYARHLMDDSTKRPACLVLHACGLLFGVTAAGGRRFIRDLDRRWQGLTPASRPARIAAVLGSYARLFTSVWIVGPWLRRRLKVHGGAPVFVVVSHHHVGHAFTIRRIRRVFKARTVCFIHDLIPIDYPEFCRSGAEARHHRAIDNAAKLFDAAIVNSETTARSLRAYIERSGNPPPSSLQICVAAPGVRPFPRPQAPAPGLLDRPYFVMLATIEPKKNHMLALNVWARLASASAQPPLLLVIGAPGWGCAEAIDMMQRSQRLRGLVIWHRHMADSDVGPALHGARALLAPSWVEGFGLPLAEALASGTPVICSDIPAFREVGRGVPEYRDPLDLIGWMNAVLDYSRPDSPSRAAQMARLADWHAPGWPEHFRMVDQLMKDLGPC